MARNTIQKKRYKGKRIYKSEELIKIGRECWVVCKYCYRLLGIQEIVQEDELTSRKNAERVLWGHLSHRDGYGFQINNHFDIHHRIRPRKHPSSTAWYQKNQVWFIPIL